MSNYNGFMAWHQTNQTIFNRKRSRKVVVTGVDSRPFCDASSEWSSINKVKSVDDVTLRAHVGSLATSLFLAFRPSIWSESVGLECDWIEPEKLGIRSSPTSMESTMGRCGPIYTRRYSIYRHHKEHKLSMFQQGTLR